ncbi:hypothetical protein [Roseibium sp.]|uniref:hypothetical protein n=1 Tax=Roseibium sp. TaxID=1936156 RepID=UPI0032633A1D
MTVPAMPPATRWIYVLGKQFLYTSQNPPSPTPGNITEDRFMIRGVAVDAASVTALKYDDVLADHHFSTMKAIFDKAIDLNINCIRVYALNPNYSHKQAMDHLKAHGIYVMVGLASAENSVHQMSGAYAQATFVHAARLVDEFQAYDNTFCFSVGNEVNFPGQQAANLKKAHPDKTDAEIAQLTVDLECTVAQAMKSFVRDVKHHIKNQGYRSIPVGMAMQDGPQSSWTNSNPQAYQRGLIGTDTLQQYYAAGTNDADRADFIGINSYRYESGQGPGGLDAYDGLAEEASRLPVPVFLSESGDIVGPTRDWKIAAHVFKTAALRDQLSGQVAFQLMDEGAGYGLFTVSESGGSVTLTAASQTSVTDLTNVFQECFTTPPYFAAGQPNHPTSAPTSFGSNPEVTLPKGWPNLLTLKTFSPPTTDITVENYNTTSKIQVVQQVNDSYLVLGVLQPATSATSPTSRTIRLYSQTAINIQFYDAKTKKWDQVCGVPAKSVKAGKTVKTDVKYGGACNLA